MTSPHIPARPQPVWTTSQSAVVVHARLFVMSDAIFCWSASHVCRFEGASVVDVDLAALAITAVGGAAMPGADDDDATTGSALMDASIAEGDSFGFVHAYKNATGAAMTAPRIASLFNRAP